MPEGAPPAEGFCQPTLGKTGADGGGAGAVADIVQGLFVDIAQGNICLTIKTAGHHGAVHQNGDMIPQPPAGALVAQIGSRTMGPGSVC